MVELTSTLTTTSMPPPKNAQTFSTDIIRLMVGLNTVEIPMVTFVLIHGNKEQCKRAMMTKDKLVK